MNLNDFLKLKEKYPERKPDTYIKIGKFTYGKPNIINYSSKNKVEIGKFSSIADNVTILLGGEHKKENVSQYPFSVLMGKPVENEYTKGDVVIGNDVWIGRDSYILGGVEIGHGAVIGANSMVASDVLPYNVVVGNPAKCIKRRFSIRVIHELLCLKWWDLEDEQIFELIPPGEREYR